MLSTAHAATMMKQTGDKPNKPKAFLEYNEHMGLVDKCDMQLLFTKTVRKSQKQYNFFHLLDLTIYNCYVLYKESKNESLQFSDFRLELVKDLCARYGEAKKLCGGRPGAQNLDRLTGRHFPSLISENKQRKCCVCSNTNMKPRQKWKKQDMNADFVT